MSNIEKKKTKKVVALSSKELLKLGYTRPHPVNDHILPPGLPLGEWLKRAHTEEELSNRLHVGRGFEELNSNDSGITDENILNADISRLGDDLITRYQTDKINEIKKSIEEEE